MLPNTGEKIRVYFLAFSGGEVFALFPDKYTSGGERLCICYNTYSRFNIVANPDLIKTLRRATPTEYKHLYDAITAEGYDLDIAA